MAQTWLDAEEGTVTTFVVVLSTALLMMAGLVYDGGRILAARRDAHAAAANAARAGAQAVDLSSLRAGVVDLEVREAEQRAQEHLRRVGLDGAVSVNSTDVTVEVTDEVDLIVLRAIGITSKTIVGRGTAQIVRGVTGPGG